jgi:hypothetical protein
VEPASKAAIEIAALWHWLAHRARGQDPGELPGAALTRLTA